VDSGTFFDLIADGAREKMADTHSGECIDHDDGPGRGRPFQPLGLLRNPHAQSIVSGSGPRRWFVKQRARRLRASDRDVVLDAGEGVRLLGHHAPAVRSTGRCVVLLHGWEGSANSNYVLSSAAYLHACGFDVFRLNFRDHGPTHHLNEGIFHSCRLAEVMGALREIRLLFGYSSLSLVGYSLGGNFALRAAARALEERIAIESVVAVCPVLDPLKTLDRLETGFFLYRQYFVAKWHGSLRRKHRAWPDRYSLSELLASRDLADMTERLVLRYTEFPTLEDYLNGYAVTGSVLANLNCPTHVVMAADDPIIPVADIGRLAPSPFLNVRVSAFGGHCGFLENLVGPSWVDREIHRLLEGGVQ